MIPIIHSDLCNGCGECVEICPPLAISIKNDMAVIDKKICEECGECVKVCKVVAIEIPEQIDKSG